jgi:hypothetical protein
MNSEIWYFFNLVPKLLELCSGIPNRSDLLDSLQFHP